MRPADPAELGFWDVLAGGWIVPNVQAKGVPGNDKACSKIPSAISHGKAHLIKGAYDEPGDWIKAILSDERLGYGIITHKVFVIDIDIDSSEEASRWCALVDETLGKETIKRRRRYEDGHLSGRVACLFRCDVGYTPKSISLKTSDKSKGIDILCGKHYCALHGVKYEGDTSSEYVIEDLEKHFDELSAKPASEKQFKALVKVLSDEWKTAYLGTAGGRVEKASTGGFEGKLTGSGQYVADKLPYHGKDGIKYFVTCPWKHEHTSGDSPTEAMIVPDHETKDGKIVRGSFKCLHASCAKRDYHQALHRLGVRDAEFDCKSAEAPVKESGGEQSIWLILRDCTEGIHPNTFELGTQAATNRAKHTNGDIQLSVPPGKLPPHLFAEYLDCGEAAGFEFAFDGFSHTPMFRKHNENGLAPFSANVDLSYLVTYNLSEKGLHQPKKFDMEDALFNCALRSEFNSAQRWLKSITWDGEDRREALIAKLGLPLDEYIRSCIDYLLTAMAGRVMNPGCMAAMVPVLIGSQGTRKSMSVQALSPFNHWYSKIKLSETDANIARLTTGCVVVELDEMRGLRTKESDSIKSWITAATDEWIPKYKEYKTRVDRSWIAIGTTNEIKLFNDSTGNRRWLPMMQKGYDRHVKTLADPHWIRANVAQLWAQGLAMFKKNGVMAKKVEDAAFKILYKFEVLDKRTEDAVLYLQEREKNVGHEVTYDEALQLLSDRFNLPDIKSHKVHQLYCERRSNGNNGSDDNPGTSADFD